MPDILSAGYEIQYPDIQYLDMDSEHVSVPEENMSSAPGAGLDVSNIMWTHSENIDSWWFMETAGGQFSVEEESSQVSGIVNVESYSFIHFISNSNCLLLSNPVVRKASSSA